MVEQLVLVGIFFLGVLGGAAIFAIVASHFQ